MAVCGSKSAGSIGVVAIYPTGRILGKALERLDENTGIIKVLITLQ